MSALAWFPIDVDRWEEITAALTIEAEGALFRIARYAWHNDPPCTFRDDPHFWGRLLGTRVRTLRPIMRLFFVPDLQHPGRVVWPFLLEVHRALLAEAEASRHPSRYYVATRRSPISRWTRTTVFERDGHRCVACGATGVELHVDHVVPLVRGGADRLDNMQTLCADCNLSKGARREVPRG